MTKERFYIDMHVIQTVPPSCVNRDDTGSPKTAFYGGANRARVSSQAWKHAMRLYFRDIFADEDIGTRTMRVADMVAEEITKIDPSYTSAAANKMAVDALGQANVKVDEKKNKSEAMFFMSIAQARAIAKLAVEKCKDKKSYEAAMKAVPSLDMALFGRMVASDPSLNYDAAAQVAHSISTHTVHNEFDFFTAVDDRAPEDNAGADHLGTVEFNSATLYRYATINVSELAKHIEADTARTVRGFAEAFICSMPTGKQNTFANRTMPDAVYITVRRDQPVNLCGAFERPVQGNNGYAEESVRRLVEQAEKTYRDYVEKSTLSLGIGKGLEGAAELMPLKDILNRLEEYVQANMPETGGVR